MHATTHTILALLVGGLMVFGSPAGLQARIDRNGDGLDDLWSARHGHGLTPLGDPDGDGLNNLAEAAAGTNPRDASSRFQLRELAFPATNRARLSWPSVPGKVYRIQASPDLRDWITLPPVFVGDGSDKQHQIDLTRSYAGGDFALSRWENLAASTSLITFKNTIVPGSTAPARVITSDTLGTATTSPNVDRFGQHSRGWIVPPADGDYRFFVSADDACEFWLGESADASTRRRLAWTDGWTDPGQWNKYPSQTSALIRLQGGRPYYFELFHVEGAGGDHVTVAWTGPGLNPDKELLSSRYHAIDPRSLADRAGSGGRLFYRISVEDRDSDGDGLSDHDEYVLATNPNDATTQPLIADMDVALARLGSRNRITLGATAPRAYEAGLVPARITVFRTGNLDPVTVRYGIFGTATSTVDYVAPSGVVTIPGGATQADIVITPRTDTLTEVAETVEVRLLSDPSFDLGAPDRATITIDDAPDELYVAALRPLSGLASAGWGSAVLRAAGNGLSARLSLTYSSLLGPAAGADLFVSTGAITGSAVLTLPAGQVSNRSWGIQPAAGLSQAAIVTALREGRLWVRVRSTAATGGEIYGRLSLATGSETSPTPPAPQALPGGTPSLADAHRFLDQAAFGASTAAVADVRNRGYSGWINHQRTLTATKVLPAVTARRNELLANSGGQRDGWQEPLQQVWWQNALTAPDQLRQRVAWALAQILVVSRDGSLADDHEALAAYYDLCIDRAFGNYRDLLVDVTRSPVMGVYLSMIRNRRPDPENGQRPDENYARELMQLFTIGLNELHPDGSLRLDREGFPIPTYTQNDIVGLAHVFTGWGPHYNQSDPPRWSDGRPADTSVWFVYGKDLMRPMSFYPQFHDTGAKRLLRGNTIPAGTDGLQAMDTAINVLFQHPNVGPFIGRQLIQRLVTSNPSPAYIARVSAAFANNGSGVRGDLFATVRAVLLDPEARLTPANATYSAGKRVEPVLRLTRLLHAFPPTRPRANDPRYFIDFQFDLSHQIPLGSPSVFNYFQPVYSQPGVIATAGLLSPEFQVTSETTVVGEANRIHDLLHRGRSTGELSTPTNPNSAYLQITLPLDAELAILARTTATPAANFAALVTHLADKYRGGRVSAELRTELLEFHAALPSWYWTDGNATTIRDRRLTVIRYALHLIGIAPETVIDR
jgi:uncharacterized protein (DUF1800 family)